MSKSTQVTHVTDQADAEVELSAQDLLALADSCLPGKQEAAPAPASRTPASAEQVFANLAMNAAKKSPPRRMSSLQMTLAVIVTVGVIGAVCELVASNSSKQSTASATPARQLMLSSPEQMTQGGQPVRFANPFDKAEVFEFPAGTSENEAREAVAALLMERANSRQKT
ncbi:MAG: hypothetical protein ABW171_02930 [Steroidobacter sp.]